MPLGINKTKFSEKEKRGVQVRDLNQQEKEEGKREKLSPQEEIAELERKLAEKKRELAKARTEAREIIEDEFKKTREVEPSIEKEKGAEVPLSERKEVPSQKVSPIPSPSTVQISDEVKRIKTLEKTHQVKVLTDLAFEKGIIYAIKVARGLNNAYILDEFHDKLVDQLYEQLVKKRRLKEI